MRECICLLCQLTLNIHFFLSWQWFLIRDTQTLTPLKWKWVTIFPQKLNRNKVLLPISSHLILYTLQQKETIGILSILFINKLNVHTHRESIFYMIYNRESYIMMIMSFEDWNSNWKRHFISRMKIGKKNIWNFVTIDNIWPDDGYVAGDITFWWQFL